MKEKQTFDIQKILNAEISFSGNGISLKKKHQFFNDLSVLLSTGVNLRDTLHILIEESTDKKVVKLYQEVYDDITSGLSLSEAIEKTKRFSVYEVYNLRIGEETGRIGETLQNLTDFLKNKIDLKRKISSAVSYPIIVLITAVGAVGFMLRFVVPMFQGIFQRLNQELPPITQTIIRISENSGSFFLYLAIVVTAFIVLHKVMGNNVIYKSILGKVLLKLPLAGDFIRKTNLARFCTSMELFIVSGVPVLKALGVVKKMSTFYPMQHAVEEMEKEVLNGVAFDKAIASHKIFDKRIGTMIRVGMEVNQLHQMFAKMKESYNEEVSYKASIINSVLEPIMIVFIGLIVSVILISMYLPIFQLSTSFGV
jgi:type IV pilus assembly protein PilC